MKKIAVLGATGSIGTTSLKVIEKHNDKFLVSMLVNFSSVTELKKLIKKYNPKTACCVGQKFLYRDGKTVPYEEDFLENPDNYNDSDIVINGIVGLAGLKPTIAVLKSRAELATANKESLVCAGSFVISTAKMYNKRIIPVDSEHSTIFQCLNGNENNLKSIILTASGGAFRNLNYQLLKGQKASDALKHPTWVMGKKVTIDSATLVNKGMEIIEAKYLFGCNKIDVVRHDESIVHSLIELNDNSLIAGLSTPDMTIPIQYALSFPKRMESGVKKLDLKKIKMLHFGEIDEKLFPCFAIAKKVAEKGDAEGTIFNAADEIAVDAYLSDKITFYEIPYFIEKALEKFSQGNINDINDIFCIDKKVREYTLNSISKIGGKK